MIKKITKKSVNQASFTVTSLKEIEIPLPPLDEQRKIAAVLDKVSSLIAKRRQQLDKLDELIKARFVEMFGDPVINSCQFPVQPMTDICDIIDGDRGKNYPKSEEILDDGYCLFLNAKNVELYEKIKLLKMIIWSL